MKNATPWISYAVIGAVLAAGTAALVYVGGGFSPDRLTQTRLLSALQVGGDPPTGFRRNHSKGLCFSGWFDSNGAAVPWSKAAVFQVGRVPLVGRFSLAGGMPFQADAATTVRSMALQFLPAAGGEWRTGMINLPVFPVHSVEAFYEQTLASKPDPVTGKPDPAAMTAFLSRHPEAARAIALIKAQAPSAGFADSTYNGLDAFRFINAAAAGVAVRWSMVPMQEAVLQATSPDDDAAVPSSKNRLFDDLIAQIHEHPLQWRLLLTLAAPEDATADPTVAWPAARRHVDAGTITVERVASEDGGACDDINFDPLVVPPGIQPSDDPILSARSATYMRSFTLRLDEKAAKPPSAITPEEAQRKVAP